MAARLLSLLTLVTLSCGDPFEPRTRLEGYRIVGLSAEPAEIRAGETTTITVHDIDTDGGTPTYVWRICLWSFGAIEAFDCIDPSLELELEGNGPRVDVDLGSDGIDIVTVASEINAIAGAQLTDVSGAVVDLEAGHDIYVKLLAGPPGGRVITAVHKLTIRDAATEAPRNTNPTFAAFEVPASGRRGTTVAMSIAMGAGSEETYYDETRESDVTEELVYTWYTTGGETDPPITFGDSVESEVTLPDEPGKVTVIVAARDGRGGLAVARREIDVTD